VDFNLVMQQFIMALLTVVTTILLPLLAKDVYLWVRAQVNKAKTALSVEQLALLQFVVDTVVSAAEQSGLAGYINAEGTAKREWALTEAQRILNERGFTNLDVRTLYTLIEDSVRRGVADANPPAPVEEPLPVE